MAETAISIEKMKIRFRLREKLMLITVGIILLAIGINAYLEVKNFIRVYKDSISCLWFTEQIILEKCK